MISLFVWFLLTAISYTVLAIVGYLTVPIAILVAVVAAVIVWGGILILDSDDFF